MEWPGRDTRNGGAHREVQGRAKVFFNALLPPGKQLVLCLGTEWLAHGHSSSANTTVTDVKGYTSLCLDENTEDSLFLQPGDP